MAEAILLFVSIVAAAILSASYAPSTAENIYQFYRQAKRIVVPVVGVIGAWILLATGVGYLAVFAAAILVLVVWGVYFEVA